MTLFKSSGVTIIKNYLPAFVGMRGTVLLLGVVGVLAIVASIFGGIAPPAFLGDNGLLVCGALFLAGIALLIGSFGLHHKSKIETVRIAMGDEAEQDAADFNKIEGAVDRGESAEDVLPPAKKEKFVVPPEVFATLNKDMTNYVKQSKKEIPKKSLKHKPVKLSSEILKVAKRKAAKKKK